MEDRLNFRFWHELEKRWFYFNFNNFDMYQECIQKYCLDDGKQIYQSTGLKDKNCKLIFEGDIVEYDFPEIGKQKAIVYFNNASFLLKPLDNFMFTKMKDGEIIGNIYENKELLEAN